MPPSISTETINTVYPKGVARSADADEQHPLAVKTANSSSDSSKVTNTIDPPVGWTDNEDHINRSGCWTGEDGDTKATMKTDYGLDNAQPIWRHHPRYGECNFIFQAEPSPGKVSYYFINQIEHEVCWIEAPSLEVIRDRINEYGKGKGSISGLETVVLE